MKSRASGRSLVSLGLILAMGVQLASMAQTSRPRYGGRRAGASSWVIPADTIIRVRMDRTLTSRTSRVGDRFTATVSRPVVIDNDEVIAAGAKVEGRITQVTPAKRAGRPGTIAVDFDGLILPDGRRLSLTGALTSDDPYARDRMDDEGRVSGERDSRPAVFVGGGGVLGAVLGGIAGGGKGAAIGGVIGAGIGVAGVLLTKGEEAEVPMGTSFGVQLRQDLRVEGGGTGGTVARRNDPRNDPSIDPAPSGRRPPVLSRPDPRSDPADSVPEDTEPADNRPAQPEPAGPEAQPEDQNDGRHADSEAEGEVTPEPAPSVEPQLPLNSPQMIQRAQEALRDEGYYEGTIDGRMSPRVENSLKVYQKENNLPQTGQLDQATADRLGILRPRPAATRPAGGQRDAVVLANIVSATANRRTDGSIQVDINTQAPTGGWRWYGEHVVNGDTLEVFARAVRPQGMATQALTRGRIELNVREGVRYVRRVVIHGAGGDLNIALGGSAPAPNRPAPARPPAASAPPASRPAESGAAMSIRQRAESLLDEYQRLIGVRMTGTDIEFEDRSKAGDAEIEVLFALDSFANAAQLYERMSGARRGQTDQRGAVMALAREARKTDAVLTTTDSRAGQSIAARWDLIRQEILRLMGAYNIGADEIDY